MMHEFLTNNRTELIDRCRSKVAQRPALETTDAELEHGITLFLDQLIKTLRVEQTAQPMRSRKVSGPEAGTPALSEIGEAAALHGRELLQHGFSVDQVVHDYGDLCQAITDLAFEQNAAINIDEFRTLNRCLDNAIATAVTEFSYQRDFVSAGKQVNALNERLGCFAHELRNLVNTATLALTAVKAGVGLSGATGGVLDHSLVAMRNLIDRSLSEVRMTAGLSVHHHLFSLAEFIVEVKHSATLEAAKVRECQLTVSPVDPELAIDADRDLLFSALGNLLQNAFKYTRPHTEVTLQAYAAGDRILIDVEDNCGGLPPGDAETMFQPFTQSGEDKGGLGLGLSISRRSVKVNQGILTVRDKPGVGCVFTVDLPRRAMPKIVPESGEAAA
jgi:signal transduction histidine kinase